MKSRYFHVFLFAHLSVFSVYLLNMLPRATCQFPSLGSHSEPAGGAMVLYGKFPPPSAFYHHFVKIGKPLLMKNVLNRTGYEAFNTWTDEYLRYGDEDVELERGKKEDRNGKAVMLPLATFLKVYQNIDLYMVHTVPPSMQDDVMVPFTLQCGGFQDNLQESVMWFSGGNTKSVLHYDSVDNINCLLDGEKKLVMIDKIHKEKVEAGGFEQDGSYSHVDVDAVDPDQFSSLLEVPWYKVEMSKGDCIYIPHRWYHHVYSPPGRNLAVNLWFSHLWWFNKTDCDEVQNDTPLKPISQFKLASPNQQLRCNYFEPFAGLDTISHNVFTSVHRCGDEQEANKLWAAIDGDGDSRLTWEEIYRVDMDNLVATVPGCFNLHDDGDGEEETRQPPVRNIGDLDGVEHPQERSDRRFQDDIGRKKGASADNSDFGTNDNQKVSDKHSEEADFGATQDDDDEDLTFSELSLEDLTFRASAERIIETEQKIIQASIKENEAKEKTNAEEPGKFTTKQANMDDGQTRKPATKQKHDEF